MSKGEIKKWNVFLPEPFILDKEITDNMIIERLTEAKGENEIASIFSSALQAPIEGYIVTCTEENLVELLINDVEDVVVSLEEFDGIYIIAVSDLNGVLIGRGEITEASEEISCNLLSNKFNKNLFSFKNRFDKGTKRMNNLAYTLKSISKEITSITKREGGKKSN